VEDILNSDKFQLLVYSNDSDLTDLSITEIVGNKAYSIGTFYGKLSKSELDKTTPYHIQTIKDLIKYTVDSIKYPKPTKNKYLQRLERINNLNEQQAIINNKIVITNLKDTVLVDSNNISLYFKLLWVQLGMLY
jgi:hypothetical protein